MRSKGGGDVLRRRSEPPVFVCPSHSISVQQLPPHRSFPIITTKSSRRVLVYCSPTVGSRKTRRVSCRSVEVSCETRSESGGERTGAPETAPPSPYLRSPPHRASGESGQEAVSSLHGPRLFSWQMAAVQAPRVVVGTGWRTRVVSGRKGSKGTDHVPRMQRASPSAIRPKARPIRRPTRVVSSGVPVESHPVPQSSHKA